MKEFKLRRQRLLSFMEDNSVALIYGATTIIRNRDTEHSFRQNSSFFYLTGIDEPSALLVLVKNANGKQQAIFFVQKRDPSKEVWTGARIGPLGAVQKYGADAAYALEDCAIKLPQILSKTKTIYYLWQENKLYKKRINRLCARTAVSVKNLHDLLDELRLIKSRAEIVQLKHAARVSALGHVKLMQACTPGAYEYQLQGLFYQHCVHFGCAALAYPSIVAGGNNAVTLHYSTNRAKLRAKDLLLIDAGGEFNNYAADITRTLPVSGKFSKAQADLYNLVLQAQLAGINAVKPGNCWTEIQQQILKVLVPGLVKLGLLAGSPVELIKEHAYRKFYLHSSGHWLGLDVHDVGKYTINDQSRILKDGMVLTVEPGIYIAADDTSVAAKYRGIGIRIEDTVLVTKNGNLVLSKAAPKTIVEIEKLMLERLHG